MSQDTIWGLISLIICRHKANAENAPASGLFDTKRSTLVFDLVPNTENASRFGPRLSRRTVVLRSPRPGFRRILVAVDRAMSRLRQ